MPGTCGALLGVLWHLIAVYFGFGEIALRTWCLMGAIAFTIIHYILTPWAQKYWNCSDPGHFILDEIIGYLVVPILTYPLLVDYKYIAIAFCLERAIDIIKLPGARYFDRKVHDATGVVMDDVIAGIYTAIILSLWFYFVQK